MLKVRHVRSSTFETKSLRSRNSHVGHSILIHLSTQIRHLGFNRFKRRSLHVLNWRDWVPHMKRSTFELGLTLLNTECF